MPTTPQRILVIGHRSFAAKGLDGLLRAQGHTVTNFSRGQVKVNGDTVTGPIDLIHENPHLEGPFDTVINFILLKDDDAATNNRFLEAVLKFCKARSVKHLIHISSVSVYSATVNTVDETSLVETDPSKKGAYGGLKVSTDLYLTQNTPADLTLTFFRPGFILAPGLINPIIGMGARLPGNQILCIGNAKNRVSVITRDAANDALVRTVGATPRGKRQVILVVDPNGPTRREYLEECCRLLGCGTKVWSFPVPLWLFAGLGGNVAAKMAGMAVKPYKVISAACRLQNFDPRVTEQQLGTQFRVDWRKAVQGAMPGQDLNFEFPHVPAEPKAWGGKKVTFIGYGGIIKQKHLPALKELGFNGQVEAFDVRAGKDPNGQEIKAIAGATLPQSDLYVIASPGRVHNQAIPLLKNVKGPVLVEKPLCYTKPEMDEWMAFERERSSTGAGSVYVLQNFRFKPNVMAMLAHMKRYNPGRLLHVEVNYQSPSVSLHSPAWRRDERGSQTLLLDYSLHYLDLACMFSTSGWKLAKSHHELNYSGQTDYIEGRMESAQYPVSFILRQGFIPRRARIMYTFQNYNLSLGFFPDTFVPHMGFDSWSVHKMEAKGNFRATVRKIADKLTKNESDKSHPLAFMAATGDDRLRNSVHLPRLTGFYDALFDLSKAVYG